MPPDPIGDARPASNPRRLELSAASGAGSALLLHEDSSSPVSPSAPPKPRPATLRRDWLLLGTSILLLLAVVLPPLVNLGRYQHKIVDVMSGSLGREVTMRAVTLRLLPTPALVMTDVAVNEQAGFGAEPSLRAPSVIAQLRLSSLWRGRLEVSRIEISDSSLNLVRDQAGRWNVGSVLLQASHVANAPTGQPRAGPTPRFPYIEITDSRVNVKVGAEKLPFSLLSANVSMWLAEPDVWQLRLDGQPVRTDIELGLADTGILRVEGSLHRATALGHMPLALHGDWTSAPLGQVSRLLLGKDPGWRGDLHASADVTGDLDDLTIRTHVLIANLHREEFSPPEPFTVDATCRAGYSRAAHTLSGLACRWPVGAGQLLLTGSLAAGTGAGPGTVSAESSGPVFVGPEAAKPGSAGTGAAATGSTLALSVQELPASFLVAVAGLARSDFAPAFEVEGLLSGVFFYNAQGNNAPLYTGGLEAPQLRLTAPGMQMPLELTDARLTAATPSPSGLSTLVLTGAPVDLGVATQAVINAQVTAEGFLLHASGSASLARLEEVGRATRLLPAALAWLKPRGTAEFDVTRSAGWQRSEVSTLQLTAPGEAPPLGNTGGALPDASTPSLSSTITSGWFRLRNAVYAPPFLAEPITLPSAQATFLPGQIAWSVPVALFHQVPIQLAATYLLNCGGQATCATHFHVSCDALDGADLVTTLLGVGAEGHLLDRLISRLDAGAATWPDFEGSIHADVFTLGRITVRDADATLSIEDGAASIHSLDGQTLGGTLRGEGTVKLGKGVPHYALSTTLSGANASAVGALFHENWGTGALNLSSQLQLAGITAAQLASTAAGEFHGEWLHGGLGEHTALAHFALWTADGRVQDQALTLTRSELTTRVELPYQNQLTNQGQSTNTGQPTGSSGELLSVSGSIAFDRALALHLGPLMATLPAAEQAVTVTGTLAHPSQIRP